MHCITYLSDTSTKKKRNPSWARRSQLRLEAFRAKKLKEKDSTGYLQTLDINTAGVSSSSTNKLVLELGKHTEESMGTGHTSPAISQIDGNREKDRA